MLFRSKELMDKQYALNDKMAEANQQRAKYMWNSTNFEQQRKHMENAGQSVGLMYGGSGAGSTSTAGGQATQPSGPTSNPVGMALQYKIQNDNILDKFRLCFLCKWWNRNIFFIFNNSFWNFKFIYWFYKWKFRIFKWTY